jgi:hypothetical protein
MIAVERYKTYPQENLNSINKKIDSNEDLMYLQNIVTELITLEKDNQEIINQQNLKKIYNSSTITIINKEQEYAIKENYNETNDQDTVLQDVSMLDLANTQDATLQDVSMLDLANTQDATLQDVSMLDLTNTQDATLQDVSMLDLTIDESDNQNYIINETSITENNNQEFNIQEVSVQKNGTKIYSSQDTNIKELDIIKNKNSIENHDNNEKNSLQKKDSVQYTSLQINQINLYKQIYPEIGFLFSNDKKLTSFKENILEEMIIFILLNQEISCENITQINTKHYIIKTVALIIAVFNSVGILAIGNNNKINAGIILSTQYLTPLYISLMYDIINDISYKSQNGYKHIIKKIVKNKKQSFIMFIKLAISVYLAYLTSTIDIRLSGDGYIWITSHLTNNKKHLNIAYYLGYFNKLILSIVIYSSIFCCLIEDIMYKTSIGYLLGIDPPPIKDKDAFINKKHIKRLTHIIDPKNRQISSQRVSNYLKKYNINNAFSIAGIQNIIINNYYDNKRHNLLLNVFSLIFAGAISMFCSLAFKQVFSSKIMLNNFIVVTGNKINETLHFTLQNGKTFICKNTKDCVKNIDFNNIYVSENQAKSILDLEKEADIAGILSGISISSSAAFLAISLTSIIFKISKDSLLKKAIKNIYFRKSNIIPYLFCCSVLPSLCFYSMHVASSYPVIEKNNLLLKNIGKKTILSATQSITITLICIHIVASRYMPILADVPRFIKYLVCKK